MRTIKALRNLNRLPEVWRCRRHTKEWFRLTAAYIGLYQNFPFTITLPSGTFEFVEPSDVATFWQIFYRDVYPVCSADRLIIDAGANIGAFTLYALLSAPQSTVIAVEPAPDCCQRIKVMLRAHGLESRCKLHEVALGKSRGETFLPLTAGSQFRRTGLNGHR